MQATHILYKIQTSHFIGEIQIIYLIEVDILSLGLKLDALDARFKQAIFCQIQASHTVSHIQASKTGCHIQAIHTEIQASCIVCQISASHNVCQIQASHTGGQIQASHTLCKIPSHTGYEIQASHTGCQTQAKKLREKSRECHNHKPQPFPDTNRKRKQTKTNKHKSNKSMKSTKISSLFPKWCNHNAKRTEKHKNKITQGKTKNKLPCRMNHKATKWRARQTREPPP